jgi:hypothetical protein
VIYELLELPGRQAGADAAGVARAS